MAIHELDFEVIFHCDYCLNPISCYQRTTDEVGTRKNWKWRGYEGCAIGGIRWATRADSDILILSGQDAQALWPIYAHLATNCSRVDLAVTARTHKCYPRLLHAYKAWLNVNGSGLARRCTTIERVDGIGMTLNVGKRASDQFGRVYDKGAEQ